MSDETKKSTPTAGVTLTNVRNTTVSDLDLRGHDNGVVVNGANNFSLSRVSISGAGMPPASPAAPTQSSVVPAVQVIETAPAPARRRWKRFGIGVVTLFVVPLGVTLIGVHYSEWRAKPPITTTAGATHAPAPVKK